MNTKTNVLLLTVVLLGAAANISCDKSSDNEPSPGDGGAAAQVWTSYKWKPLRGAFDNYQFVIFPNNDCLDYLPEGGLLGFSKSTDTATERIWGKAVDKGEELHLEFSNGTVRKLGKISDSKVSYPPGSNATFYYRSKSVNGLKIEGAYAPDAELYQIYQSTPATSIVPGQGREIIFFRKDGTYYNEGISYSNITHGNSAIYGNGAYTIRDFSLVLTNTKGDKWQFAFTGIQDADPAADQSGFMINGLVNYKLGK